MEWQESRKDSVLIIPAFLRILNDEGRKSPIPKNFKDITSQYILIVVVIKHLAVDVRLADVPGIVGGNSIP